MRNLLSSLSLIAVTLSFTQSASALIYSTKVLKPGRYQVNCPWAVGREDGEAIAVQGWIELGPQTGKEDGDLTDIRSPVKAELKVKLQGWNTTAFNGRKEKYSGSYRANFDDIDDHDKHEIVVDGRSLQLSLTMYKDRVDVWAKYKGSEIKGGTCELTNEQGRNVQGPFVR